MDLNKTLKRLASTEATLADAKHLARLAAEGQLQGLPEMNALSFLYSYLRQLERAIDAQWPNPDSSRLRFALMDVDDSPTRPNDATDWLIEVLRRLHARSELLRSFLAIAESNHDPVRYVPQLVADAKKLYTKKER